MLARYFHLVPSLNRLEMTTLKDQSLVQPAILARHLMLRLLTGCPERGFR